MAQFKNSSLKSRIESAMKAISEKSTLGLKKASNVTATRSSESTTWGRGW